MRSALLPRTLQPRKGTSNKLNGNYGVLKKKISVRQGREPPNCQIKLMPECKESKQYAPNVKYTSAIQEKSF